MKNAQLLILISCCYHKLSISKNEKEMSNNTQYFDNFPMSQCLQKAIANSNLDTSTFLRQPFLRLACQESAERWISMSQDSHDIHAFHVLARAVLELYVKQSKYMYIYFLILFLFHKLYIYTKFNEINFR